MPPKVAPPRPRVGQQRQRRPVRRERLDGLGSPAPVLIRASTPISTTISKQPVLSCSNPHCPDPNVVETEDGAWVCSTCGAVAREESHLVGEVEFTELQGGRIAQAGTHIGATQSHQRTYALGGATGVAGREATATREKTEGDARRIMQRYVYLPDFRIRESEVDSGMNVFKLAYSNGFIQGRTIESVAIVSLYLACRRKHTQEQGIRRPVYALMLIDFAETLNINVFSLGRMYNDLVRKLYLRSDGRLDDRDSADLLAMGPEVLVERFVSDLSFGPDERKVRDDAIRIVRRMNRDWMTTGRRPSGVCGAAILLAARMNNYRRTTREVVLTAKVTEITINKRLEEFRETEGSKLSVTDFRDPLILDTLNASDPPAYTRGLIPPDKRKRGRPKKTKVPISAAEIEDSDAGLESDRAASESQPETDEESEDPSDLAEPASKKARVDADGYKIPEIPPQRRVVIDLSQNITHTIDEQDFTEDDAQSTSSLARGRGRPPGAKNWRAPPPTTAELEIEADIERDLLEALRQNPELDPDGSQTQSPTNSASPEESAELEVDIPELITPTSASQSNLIQYTTKSGPAGPAVDSNVGNLGHVSLSPTLKPDEFDDDPDISTCLLNEEEKQLKERVWVTANADWLRQDHAKRIKRELKEAEMREKGIDPTKQHQKGAPKRKKDGSRRAGRPGDVSYLNEPEGGRQRHAATTAAGDETGQEDAAQEDGRPISRAERERTASESVRKMMKTRGVYSRRVNYDVLDSIYGADTSDNRSRSTSVSASASASQEANTQNSPAREGSVAGSVASSASSVLVGITPKRKRQPGSKARTRTRSAKGVDKGTNVRDPNQQQRSSGSGVSGSPASQADEAEDDENEVQPGSSTIGASSSNPRSKNSNQNILPTPPSTLPVNSGSRSQPPTGTVGGDSDQEDEDNGDTSGEDADLEVEDTQKEVEEEDDNNDEEDADDGHDDDDDDDDGDEEDDDDEDADDDLNSAFQGRY